MFFFFYLLKDLEIKIQETRQRFKNEFVQGECVLMSSVPPKFLQSSTSS